MKYNNLNVPEQIKTGLIISAFENSIDYNKLEEYTDILREEMLSNNFPPIKGFPRIISEDDIDREFLTGELVEEHHIGKLAWMVTDGHHRSLANIAANVPYVRTELDYSCITNEEELNQYN